MAVPMSSEEPARYAGEPIPHPPERLTRAQKLELLLWYPLFTGKCPQCGQAISPHPDKSWQCEVCGWQMKG